MGTGMGVFWVFEIFEIFVEYRHADDDGFSQQAWEENGECIYFHCEISWYLLVVARFISYGLKRIGLCISVECLCP